MYIFDFVNEVRELKINKSYTLVSYDVSSLFTNIPLDETIAILTEKAIRDNWFNSTYNLNISKEDLIDLLNLSTKGQLFQFNGALYEQTDGVAMGSPLGPWLANDNGVMKSPKRREIISLGFTRLCITKSLLIRILKNFLTSIKLAHEVH